MQFLRYFERHAETDVRYILVPEVVRVEQRGGQEGWDDWEDDEGLGEAQDEQILQERHRLFVGCCEEVLGAAAASAAHVAAIAGVGAALCARSYELRAATTVAEAAPLLRSPTHDVEHEDCARAVLYEDPSTQSYFDSEGEANEEQHQERSRKVASPKLNGSKPHSNFAPHSEPQRKKPGCETDLQRGLGSSFSNTAPVPHKAVLHKGNFNMDEIPPPRRNCRSRRRCSHYRC
jgi:hypothetical protein